MPQGMYGIQWARVLVAMVIVYVVVEVEKALVDPVLMPIVSPVLDFIEEHSPKFLRIPKAVVSTTAKGLGKIPLVGSSNNCKVPDDSSSKGGGKVGA